MRIVEATVASGQAANHAVARIISAANMFELFVVFFFLLLFANDFHTVRIHFHHALLCVRNDALLFLVRRIVPLEHCWLVVGCMAATAWMPEWNQER